MDNVCHTLVGAALARTGLKRRTALASSTMMIGANFPDIDIFSAALGPGSTIEYRRGITHGLLALAVLPFVLAALMLLWNRVTVSRRVDSDGKVVPRQILLLSAISIWTHPTLDWMNSYGMRWLMPFDGTWFYGDSLFIVDPWLWIALGVGVLLSRRRERADAANPWKPARIAVGASVAYIIAMMGLQNVAEGIARENLAGTGRDREKLVVTASPANPLWWRVHADDGARYTMGHVKLYAGRLDLEPETLDKGAGDPRVVRALRDESDHPFLDWARLPFYRVAETPEGTVVRVTDARYGAAMAIPVTPKPPKQ